MSKQLRISYGDITLFDAPVDRITFSETGSGSVEVKAGPERGSSGGGGVLDQLMKTRGAAPRKGLTNDMPVNSEGTDTDG